MISSLREIFICAGIRQHLHGAVGGDSGIRSNFAQTLADTPVGGNVSLLATYKQNINLRDLLVHSHLPMVREHLQLARKPRVVRVIPLNTENCIYIIRCSRCGRQYVGQTKKYQLIELYQHRYVIHSKRPSERSRWSLVKHFLRHGVEFLQIQGLEHNSRRTKRQRLYKEHLWIKRLNTRVHHGLNERRFRCVIQFCLKLRYIIS